jgi:predicted phosphodiesterase
MSSDVITFTGPVLLFGGPYSNFEATDALLAEAARRGFGSGDILCTGDLAAYCADPQAVIDRVRAAGLRVVMGNCEESLAARAADCGCGFADGTACAVLSDQWYAYADRHVDAESRAWMGALPRRLEVEIGGRRLTVIHGGVRRIDRFVFASAGDAIEEELAGADCDGVIAGHCGLPFTREIGGRLWHNPGVIGMPAADGTPRVWFSVITPADDGLVIAHEALAYDHGLAAAKMRARGLPEGYAKGLETGCWPSLDVLPPAERAATGRPLTPGRIVWRPAGPGPAAHWPHA